MRAADREAARRRADFRCGYCGVREEDAGSRLTIDHYKPTSQGGTDELINLVYCCHACNNFKGESWFGSDAPDHILHPHLDDLTQHIAENAERLLVGLTQTEQFHIACLHLNRPELTAYRQKRASEVAMDRRIRDQELETARLSAQVREFELEAHDLISRLRHLDREEDI